jgi:hypothetical protein
MDQFVLESVHKKPVPAPEKTIRLIFRIHYANVDVEIKFKNPSDLTVRVGPHQLL